MSVAAPLVDDWVDAELTRFLNDRGLVPYPWPMYARLREQAPVFTKNGITLITSYKLVNALFRDPRMSRHEAAVRESAAHGTAGTEDEIMEEAHVASISMLINQDEPAHRRIRRILDKAFRPKAVAEWQPRVQAITDELIDGVRGKSEFDLMTSLAYPLPERVICELMGVPREDHVQWNEWIGTVVATSRTSAPSPEVQRKVSEAHKGFLLYFRDLVKKRKADLSDDLVSELIRAESEGDRLNELELLGTLQMLIAAGGETTANLVGNGMLALMQNPDQYDLLRSDPAALMPAAIEEFLRFDTPSDWALPRMALEDVDAGGTTIGKGSIVLFSPGAANRDPAAFERAEMLDITRPNNRHISFAAGPHFCLGAMLARQEAQFMFSAICTQLPRLELDDTPAYKTTFVRALKSLRVRTS